MPTIKVYRRPKRDPHNATIKKYSRPKQHNFLKYWRIIRHWAKKKYDLSTEEIEMLLYLYDQPLFSRKEFITFEGLLTWDKRRLNMFVDKGLIVVWREHVGYTHQSKMFELSIKSKRMCSSIYKKLTQEEHIPENPHNNPVFRGSGYVDKMYRKVMKQMNLERDKK